jgi:hypothetical protein
MLCVADDFAKQEKVDGHDVETCIISCCGDAMSGRVYQVIRGSGRMTDDDSGRESGIDKGICA